MNLQKFKMKSFILMYALSCTIICLGQGKKITDKSNHVFVRLDKVQNLVFIVDSNNNQLHRIVNVISMDTSTWKGLTVYHFYGANNLISWCETFISYDEKDFGIVYVWKEEN